MLLGAATVALPLGCASSTSEPLGGEVWASATGGQSSEYGVSFAQESGRVTTIPTGVRGHDVILHPQDSS
ncbi:MAG: hypothetical protein MK135_13790, partial [Polyangiaceae bacterium]|nr:hypothetical protein [Polyangiaceae bacterium]